MGVEHSTGTDTRTETTDKPTASERPYAPPPDNPGSPGQPSRLQDRARAREQARESGEQDDSATETGTEQAAAERDDKPAASRNESNGEATGSTEFSGQEKDEGEPQKKDDDASQDGDAFTAEATGDRDQTAPGPRTPETGRPQDREHEPLPRQDRPDQSDLGEPPTSEQDAHTSNKPVNDNGLQEERTEGTPAPSFTDQQETRPDTAADNLQPGDRTTQPTRDTDQTFQVSDGTPDNSPPRPEDRPDFGEPAPEDGKDRPTDPQESRTVSDALDTDRGRNVEDDRTTPSPTETSEPTPEAHDAKAGERTTQGTDQGSALRGDTKEPGGALAPHEANEAESASDRFVGRITIPVDTDGSPIPRRRSDIEHDTPERGEPQHPDDDPADRGYNETDPERRSRIRDLMGEFTSEADNAKDSVEKFTEPAQKQFEDVRPTGQFCGARNSGDTMKPLAEPVKTGDAALAAVGTAILAAETFRYAVNAVQRMRRSEDASHR